MCRLELYSRSASAQTLREGQIGQFNDSIANLLESSSTICHAHATSLINSLTHHVTTMLCAARGGWCAVVAGVLLTGCAATSPCLACLACQQVMACKVKLLMLQGVCWDHSR